MSDSESASSEHDVNVELTDAGAEDSYPIQCGKVRKGAFIVIDGHACKVAEVSTSKTGKHGHAKANITGIDIFDGSKLTLVCPTSHNVYAPNIVRTEYQLMDINDGYCELMNTEDTNDTRSDLKVPEDEIGQKIVEAFEGGELDVIIIVVKAMKKEMISDYKTV